MPLSLDIADAVVSELNNAQVPPAPGFVQPFVAVRAYRPVYDLADLKTLRVTVVPKGLEIVNITRNANQNDVSVDVAVQQKVDPNDSAQMDALMQLVEKLGDFFRLRRLTALPTALWTKTENVPIYAPEHLETKQVFTSVLTLTFRVVR
jgi:hypothetical protein